MGRYRTMYHEGRTRNSHRVRAERVFGKPLPKGSVVHHVDGSRDENAPLVICQDQAYHKLLHWNMFMRSKGGNPFTDSWCARCETIQPKENFTKFKTKSSGVAYACKPCQRKNANAWYAANKATPHLAVDKMKGVCYHI